MNQKTIKYPRQRNRAQDKMYLSIALVPEYFSLNTSTHN